MGVRLAFVTTVELKVGLRVRVRVAATTCCLPHQAGSVGVAPCCRRGRGEAHGVIVHGGLDAEGALGRRDVEALPESVRAGLDPGAGLVGLGCRLRVSRLWVKV